MDNAHLVIATVGSLGDLFPFLAVGQELQRRGHRVTVATHAIHQDAIEQAGLAFANASGMAEPEDRAAFTTQAFHPRRGPRFVVHDFAAMDVRASYEKLASVCTAADVLITTTLAFAGQILGETLSAQGRLRWLSAVLAPAGFISAFDPPAMGIAPLDAFIRRSSGRGRRLRRVAEWVTHSWTQPVREFRAERGLPPQSALGDPFHRGQHAPQGVLALFSPLLGRPQPDWPTPVGITGFARYVQATELDPALAAFLDAGRAPLVFTLGSAAVHIGVDFLRESLAAAVQLNQRAVLLTGSAELRAQLPAALPSSVHAIDYAAHSALFPRASIIVHHGGIGTSSEALRSGRPMLVVPHGFDQPDNAARLQRLGVAEVLPANRYRAIRAVPLLQKLMTAPNYSDRAEACRHVLHAENGARDAADVIEEVINKEPDSQDGNVCRPEGKFRFLSDLESMAETFSEKS
jgi:rhamnosyltransferase subunit B